MFGMSLGHLLILALVVILFGPKRVSSLAEQLGKSIRGIRDQLDSAKEATGITSLSDSIAKVREDMQPKITPAAKTPPSDSAKT